MSRGDTRVLHLVNWTGCNFESEQQNVDYVPPVENVALRYRIPTGKTVAQVAEEIRQQWPTVEGIAIVQRIGRLDAGTPTVLIACTAAHRDTGVFEAARYGIDRLKQIVPVWKKEIGPDGEAWVEGDYRPQPRDRRP